MKASKTSKTGIEREILVSQNVCTSDYTDRAERQVTPHLKCVSFSYNTFGRFDSKISLQIHQLAFKETQNHIRIHSILVEFIIYKGEQLHPASRGSGGSGCPRRSHLL